MPERWTGNLVGRMHNERITYDELATELGVTKSYISMILNGKRSPNNARVRMENAVNRIVCRRHDPAAGNRPQPDVQDSA